MFGSFGNLLLGVVLWLETLTVFVFVLPYTNYAKVSIVDFVAGSRALEAFRTRYGYEVVFVWLFLWYRNVNKGLNRAVAAADGNAVREGMKRARMIERLKFAMLLLVFTKRSHERIVEADKELLVLADRNSEERAFLDFKPPSKTTAGVMTRIYRACFDPVVLGEENLIQNPRPRPVLYVSNHSVLGLEYPVLLFWLYKKHDIFLRVLADRSHFQIPLNAKILRDMFGAVDGTRRNVDMLMAKKEPVFVFPGGAREAFKRTTDDQYELFWEGKNGFAAMAIKWGCDICPICNVGTEDMLEVRADLPLGWIPIPYIYGTDRTLPIVFPKTGLQRLYFHIGKPIPTEQYGGEFDNENYVEEVKFKVQTAVEDSIKMLRERRKEDYPEEEDFHPEFPRKNRSVAEDLVKYIRALTGSKL